jgi:hypothetical protein
MKRFDRLGYVDRVLLTILITSVTALLFPYSASAQTSNQNFVFEIKNLQNLKIPQIALYNVAQITLDQTATVDQAAIDKQNAEILQAYLEKKGSPLAPYAASILQNENWKLVLAISNGESTLCKHQRYYNCWGIGGAWNLRHYNSFDQGFSDVSRLITTKYVASGGDTPEKIVNKYVGHANANWVVAVNRILNEVNQLPLQLN